MKRYFMILLLISLFFINVVDVFAYDTTNYKIDLPNNYKKSDNKDIWTFESNKDITTISVVAIANKSNVDISKINEETLDESLLNDLNKNLNTQEKIDVKTSDLALIKVNDYNAIKININSSLKTEEEFISVVYQTQYIFSSKKYLYYLVVSSSNKDVLSSKDINNIINSFTIKDEMNVDNKRELKKYYITLSVIILSGVIIMVIVKKK